MLLENEIKVLIKKLNEATEAYDKGTPYMTDEEWDNFYFTLASWENETGIYFPDSPTQKIHYTVVDKLNKVEHNHPMLSLAKTKDMNEFSHYFNNIDSSKDVIGMLKLDGLTCSLKYLDGKLVSAETRGNGIIGEDIRHNAKAVKSIPKVIDYKEELIIDGEIICTYKDFEKFSNDYKNPRNFAAGSIRLLDSSECAARNLTFVVWNIIKGFNETNSFMTKLQQAEKQGFTITPYTSSIEWDWADYLKSEAKDYGYPIDGLVGRFDDVEFGESLGSTDHHSKAAFAFKFYDEEYESELINIIYDIGRTNVLTPVAVFNPVEIDGSIVEKASLHNLSIMKDILGIPYVGQKITVAKMNMIIPQIMSAEKKESPNNEIMIPSICPICGQPTERVESDSGTIVLTCSNKDCGGKLSTRIDHFAGKDGLDIKGISRQTLDKLIDYGWINKIEDIFNLKDHRTEWIRKPGFGPKSVDNILQAIEDSKQCSFDAVISAFGIPLVGKVLAKDLITHFSTYDEFRDAINNKFNFLQFDGYGPELKKALLNFDYSEMDNIVNNYLDIQYTSNLKNDTLKDITFVITGSLKHFKNRDELVGIITKNGGKVSSAVSRRTNYLINNDINSSSSKNENAKKMNIPIITENDFIDKFLN